MVMPISPRRTASCHHSETKACGTITSAVATKHPTMTFQLPIRSASAPRRGAVSMLPKAEAAITRPAMRAWLPVGTPSWPM
ncbi:hypothetical protein D3C87_2103430 [compost metagenome]